MNKGNCALLVIDMSNEQFKNESGSLPLYQSQSVVKNIRSLAATLEKNRVVDTRLWFTSNDESTLQELYPDVGHANSKGAEIIEDLKDLKMHFMPKKQYSAFWNSKLHEHLQGIGAKNVLISGINTDWCCFATALDAFYLGYTPYLIQDGCTSIQGRQGHKQGIEEFKRFMGTMGVVCNTDDLISGLSS